jgi:hypothetical protein
MDQLKWSLSLLLKLRPHLVLRTLVLSLLTPYLVIEDENLFTIKILC